MPPPSPKTAFTLGQALLSRFIFHSDDSLRPCGNINGAQMGKLDHIETISATRGVVMSTIKSDVWLRYQEITEGDGRTRRVRFEFSDSSDEITNAHNHPTFFHLVIEETNIGQGGGSKFTFTAHPWGGIYTASSFDLRDTDAIRCVSLVMLAWTDVAKKNRVEDLPAPRQ